MAILFRIGGDWARRRKMQSQTGLSQSGRAVSGPEIAPDDKIERLGVAAKR
ncbi:hypothetical protein [Mesorhizobium abyssinicae]|uniref:hypothetical protein n=1 Tax=Mesorhizobium abyssinicae TaxID=1209958 RepID=UPI00339808DC